VEKLGPTTEDKAVLKKEEVKIYILTKVEETESS
jgi:hypothetical protein